MANQDKRRGPDDPNRRVTKAERKEEARRERERIQQQMKARNRNRNIGLALVALAVAAVVVVVFVVQPGKSSSDLPSPKSLLDDAAAAAKSSGCSTVQQTPNYDNAPGDDPDIDHVHIGDSTMPTAPPLSSYPTIPPASGPHAGIPPGPFPAGVYGTPPDIYRSIHSLEHGGVVIWYAPSAAGSDAVKQIEAFYSQPAQTANVGQAKVIVAPYHFPDQGPSGELPQGVQMAVVAWHRLLTCATPNLAAAFNFASAHEFPPVAGQKYVGVAREPQNSL